MSGGIFALRRLRWKLALSYTLVTVLALLVAELVLLAALIAFAISPVVPSLAARYVGDEVAPRLRSGLAESPPDTETLSAEVGSLSAETNVEMVPERDGGGVDLSLGPDDGYLFVVDENRRLLASSARRTCRRSGSVSTRVDTLGSPRSLAPRSGGKRTRGASALTLPAETPCSRLPPSRATVVGPLAPSLPSSGCPIWRGPCSP